MILFVSFEIIVSWPKTDFAEEVHQIHDRRDVTSGYSHTELEIVLRLQ